MPSEEYEDIVVRILLLDSYDRLLLLRGGDGDALQRGDVRRR